MTINIIEQIAIGKNPDQGLNEDRLIVTDDFVVCFDGATSKGEWRPDDMSTGRYLANMIAALVNNEFPKNITAFEAIILINKNINQAYKDFGVFALITEKPWERMIGSIAIYSRFHHQIWCVGDVQYRYNNQTFDNFSALDAITSAARCAYIEALLLSGKTKENIQQHDEGRDFILPLLKRQSYFQNIDPANSLALAAIDGTPLHDDHIKIHDVPADVTEIIMASDGYPLLFDTLNESEKHVQYLLEKDPLCFRENKQTKGLQKGQDSFDDRSYIRFQLYDEAL